jgi:hypothetical protein
MRIKHPDFVPQIVVRTHYRSGVYLASALAFASVSIGCFLLDSNGTLSYFALLAILLSLLTGGQGMKLLGYCLGYMNGLAAGMTWCVEREHAKATDMQSDSETPPTERLQHQRVLPDGL